MARPRLPTDCSFTGSATAIHIRGRGVAVFTDVTEFSSGKMARVVLHASAKIDGKAGPLTIEDPQANVEPIGMNPPGSEYDVHYVTREKELAIVVEGGDSGSFQGRLDGVDCEQKPCMIDWSSKGAKAITLSPATREALVLSSSFPAPGEPRGTLPKVEEVTLENPRGTLLCNGKERTINTRRLLWPSSEAPYLSVEPIRLSDSHLTVEITSNKEPRVEGRVGMMIALGATIGVLALMTALLLVWRLRRRGVPPRGTVQNADPSTGAPLKVFYSYAEEDEDLRAELEKHLALLERRGLIQEWHHRLVRGGADWKSEVDARLEEAQIILLLISKDFMASDYSYEVEVKRAMQKHRDGSAQVIPVLLRPYALEGAPFSGLRPLPNDGRSVVEWSDQDAALRNIAEGIQEVVEEYQRRQRALPDTKDAA